jgi:molybdopterin synthase catalytic subunit
MIELREDDIPIDDLVRAAKGDRVGAIVTFIGTVRNDGIERMELEAYPEVAAEELGKIEQEALEKFAITSLDIIHRIGHLVVGDTIVLIVAAAAHRKDAFLACEYAIEELKRRVPIWKKEIGPSGEVWVEGYHRDRER